MIEEKTNNVLTDNKFTKRLRKKNIENDKSIEANDESIIESNEWTDSGQECQQKDNNFNCSPIEEMRGEPEWYRFQTSTSTPNSLKDTLPDLNISSISCESNDSNMLFNRQISRFQITDELINSCIFDEFEPNEEKSLINTSDK
ncbi:uncharacterized protein LOC128952570 [Oppia nitens]|uniref:uncharacterized protein LOC128952570 n=1 Tax=Oppia nitens TaxID=1686743 RepID=UPI0023DAE025|nr:uncharacterized protein LOC128952570 [Oppia nitens]